VQCSENEVALVQGDERWLGKLLLIADGAHSPARQILQVAMTQWSYEQHALVAVVQVEKPHKSTAYQVFQPDGPLAFLPLPESHKCSIVWSTSPERAQSLMAMDDKTFNAELTRTFAAKLGDVAVEGMRYQFPLKMRHVQQYAGNRWLLLGDAAHTIHPLAGLGLNLGLADVANWLEQLDASSRTLVSKKMLGAYQRSRKAAVWQTIVLMEGFKRLFSYQAFPLVSLRAFGLRLCNHSGLLKRLFIQHASGSSEQRFYG
jgi:2-octaprenylphenol hydroxylase